jgi:hypothetical protein
MAKPTFTLIDALRETAQRLRNGAHYAWGNHGVCNCGNLLQVLTDCTGKDILAYAHTGIGEWTELANEYCGVSQLPVDMLISKLMEAGLHNKDIHNIEYLDNKEVLTKLPGGFRWLKRNKREDVIVYFETYADILEEQLNNAVTQQRRNLAKRRAATVDLPVAELLSY